MKKCCNIFNALDVFRLALCLALLSGSNCGGNKMATGQTNTPSPPGTTALPTNTPSTAANDTIYTWTKVALPGGSTFANITYFVVSKDNQHAYLRSIKAGDEGLYHSADDGATWTLLGAAK